MAMNLQGINAVWQFDPQEVTPGRSRRPGFGGEMVADGLRKGRLLRGQRLAQLAQVLIKSAASQRGRRSAMAAGLLAQA